MPTAFVSHSSRDKPFVRKLVTRLQDAGVDTWLDEIELRVGEPIIERIGHAIKTRDFVVAVLSAASCESPWVRRELQLALTHEIHGQRISVLPVLIEDCPVPDYLQDKLYADFRNGRHFAKAFGSLLKGMGITATVSRSAPPDRSPSYSQDMAAGLRLALSATPAVLSLDSSRDGDSGDVVLTVRNFSLLPAVIRVIRVLTASSQFAGLAEMSATHRVPPRLLGVPPSPSVVPIKVASWHAKSVGKTLVVAELEISTSVGKTLKVITISTDIAVSTPASGA